MENTISFTATGDYLVTRRIPSYEDANFQYISRVLRKANVRITNLETTISYNEGTPAAISGGFHLQTTPDRLKDLKAYGFNLVSTANNHTLDYSYDGLSKTEQYLRQHGISYAGTGENLFAAGKPAYFDTIGGRVAFIAVAPSAHKTWLASKQRHDIKGRPGVNGLRHIKAHIISREKFAVLKQIADETEVNSMINMMVKEGFLQALPETMLPFGTDLHGFPMIFQIGEAAGLVTQPHPLDLKRITESIDDASRQADYVIVSFHGHEMKGEDKEVPADFHVTAAKSFIDAGAHAVIGHGPHVLRGIEIYKNRPIFYSLGNFIFQSETLEVLPQEFYDENNIPSGYTIMQAMDKKTTSCAKWLANVPEVMESVLPFWTMKNGEIQEIVLYPLELGCEKKRHQQGFPAITTNEEILQRIANLSKPFGTKISINDGIGRITL